MTKKKLLKKKAREKKFKKISNVGRNRLDGADTWGKTVDQKIEQQHRGTSARYRHRDLE